MHALSNDSPAVLLHAGRTPVARPQASLAIFSLQRQLLMRARGELFARLAGLGGVPTIADDTEQAALDAQATRDMCRDLRDVLADAFVHASLTAEHRDYWAARAPAMLCFGARQHGELTRLVASAHSDAHAARTVHTVALFQLAASLLDWIGDDAGGGAEMANLLPAGALPGLVVDAERRAELCRGAERCSGMARAFVTVLVALLERAARLPVDLHAFATLLGAAYDAELDSFDAEVTPARDREVCARRKSELPTLVCGSLAGAGLDGAERAIVEGAAAAMAPLLSSLDDMADLSDDLRAGALNALAPACARDDASVEAAMRELLAGDMIEQRSAEAAACILRVHAIALAAGVSTERRRAITQWLRTRAWRWLS